MKSGSQLIRRYSLSLGAVLLALLVFRGLDALVVGELPPFITFYPTIMIVALLAGIGPGLAATALAALCADYWILAPRGHFGASARDAVTLALFTGLGVFMSAVAEMYRRARPLAAGDLAGERFQRSPAQPRHQVFFGRLLIGAGLAASLVIMLTVYSLVHADLTEENEADSSVFHSQEVIGNLEHFLSELKDAETGERGYLITGSAKYLEPYHAAVLDMDDCLNLLLKKSSDNPALQKQLTRLGSLSRDMLSQLGKTIALRREGGFPAAQAEEETGRGKFVMDEIRQLVAKAQAGERRLLQERIAVTASQRDGTRQALMGGGVLSLILLGTVFLFLIQENRLRRKAEDGLLEYQDHLRDLVAIRTGELAQANHELQQELVGRQQAREELKQSYEVLEQRVTERTAELVHRNAQLLVEVSERKKAEDALSQGELRYRAVVEAQTELITRFRPDWSYSFANEAFCRFFGSSHDEIIGRSWQPEVLADDIPMVVEKLQLLSARHPIVVTENRVVAANGDTRWIQSINRGFFDAQGKLLETQAVGRDITERKQLEEALQRYAQRLILVEEDLRKSIARELHDDIGQVLTALGFNLAHINHHLPEGSGEKIRLTLEDSRLLTKEISRSVRNLMVDLRPSQLDEYGLPAAIRSYADQYAQRTGIVIGLQIDPELARLPVKQELALFRITQEALNNVVKYAAATQVSVSLGSDGTATRLSICDDGRGFVPDTSLPLPTGSGWGLTIMRERAELAGGRFRLDTVPGTGTSIVIEIPEETPNGY
jgi:two-component system, NarL family, sensor histidine kinase UhpB